MNGAVLFRSPQEIGMNIVQQFDSYVTNERRVRARFSVEEVNKRMNFPMGFDSFLPTKESENKKAISTWSPRTSVPFSDEQKRNRNRKQCVLVGIRTRIRKRQWNYAGGLHESRSTRASVFSSDHSALIVCFARVHGRLTWVTQATVRCTGSSSSSRRGRCRCIALLSR